MATLAAELGTPARAYLTGAAAAALWGRVRPSYDVDLGLELKRKTRSSGEIIQRAVERTTRLTGIAVSVAEDIDRWGMITLLDYKRTSRRYRQFGPLELRLLHPANWSIGKLTRNLESDIRDVWRFSAARMSPPRRSSRPGDAPCAQVQPQRRSFSFVATSSTSFGSAVAASGQGIRRGSRPRPRSGARPESRVRRGLLDPDGPGPVDEIVAGLRETGGL